jgi:pimeloyl-ACP methyl ester carboxylesterase
MNPSHLVHTRDIRMSVRQAGTGEPVLLIHGFPQTSFEWRHQIAALSDKFAVFAADNRGFGSSDKPGTRISRALLARDVVNLMDAQGIERANIVGHDWGGFIAFKVAMDYPERVSRLALLDTFCTVWGPMAVHGYWFKAQPLPEDFFARHHKAFIECMFGGRDIGDLPTRPASPWRFAPAPPWADADEVAEYVKAFSDPESHRAAISYYRNALPFHRVIADEKAAHGERFEILDDLDVAKMWTHPGGLEAHPEYKDSFDFGPEDRHKRFPRPTLWMMGRGFGGGGAFGEIDVPRGAPMLDQFSRYFPNLKAHRVDAGHFFPEEAAQETSNALLKFLSAPLPRDETNAAS